MIEITSVDESAWETWREVRLRALSESPYAFGSTYEGWVDAPESRWRDRLSIDGGLHLLALDGGAPCGMASGIPGEREGTSELISMWVDPGARGRGVVDLLIDGIAQWAGERSGELWLAVVPTNDRAIAAYRRHGFEPVDDEKGDALADGSGYELLMVKQLRGVAESGATGGD